MLLLLFFPCENISTGSSCGVYHHNRKNIYQAPLCSLSFLDLCCHHCQHFFLIGFAILGWGNFITREMDHDHDEHCQRIRHFYFQAVSWTLLFAGLDLALYGIYSKWHGTINNSIAKTTLIELLVLVVLFFVFRFNLRMPKLSIKKKRWPFYRASVASERIDLKSVYYFKPSIRNQHGRNFNSLFGLIVFKNSSNNPRQR